MKPYLFWLASALALVFCAAPLRQIPASLDPSNPEGPEGATLHFQVLAEEKSEPAARAQAAQSPEPEHPESNTHHHHASDALPVQPHDMQTPATQPSAQPHDSKESATRYVCPMHPEVVRAEPGRCPKCGMKLVLQKTPPAGSKTSPDPAPANNGAGHNMHMHGAEGSKP